MLAKTEPVRRYLYGIGAPLLALLVYLGVISGDAVPLILAVAAAVLYVPAVEGARAKVTPVEAQPDGSYVITSAAPISNGHAPEGGDL